MAAPEAKKDRPDSKPEKEPKGIKVTVSFPLAGKGPFKDEVEPTTLVEAMRQAAMAHFEVADDETTVFYLTHKGDRVDANATVGDLADEARTLKFTLAKELFQG